MPIVQLCPVCKGAAVLKDGKWFHLYPRKDYRLPFDHFTMIPPLERMKN